MKITGILAVLLVSGALATPAYANFFSNPVLGFSLNIGSAPNPTPAQLRAFQQPIITQDDTKAPIATADAAKPDAPVAQNPVQPANSTPPIAVATEQQ